MGVQIGSGRGSDWGVGVQIGAGGGSDWPRVAARVEGFRLGYGPDPIAILLLVTRNLAKRTNPN